MNIYNRAWNNIYKHLLTLEVKWHPTIDRYVTHEEVSHTVTYVSPNIVKIYLLLRETKESVTCLYYYTGIYNDNL